MGGAILPSLAASLHLNDRQSGLLFFLYFLGTAIGALFCTRAYASRMVQGFTLAAAAAIGIAFAGPLTIHPLFFCFGIGIGAPMSAVSMIAGQRFAARSAAPLTLLNFSWSAGALLAPLAAARLLTHHSYAAGYAWIAAAAALAAMFCALVLRNAPEAAQEAHSNGASALRWILLFGLLTFLEVGIENTTVTWLATFVLRTSAKGDVHAAAVSSLYWIGFLAARGLSSALLLRLDARRFLAASASVALLASVVLISAPSVTGRNLGMFILGASLAPIFPLLLSLFFARVPKTAESRWVLASCGFGGSVLPWMAGTLSQHTGSLQAGLAIIPASMLVILCTLPALRTRSVAQLS